MGVSSADGDTGGGSDGDTIGDESGTRSRFWSSNPSFSMDAWQPFKAVVSTIDFTNDGVRCGGMRGDAGRRQNS